MGNIRQLSFAGGEVSPSLYGRVDQTKYAFGLTTCRNFIVQRHGGVANRAGTEFVAEVNDSSKVVRLIPFVFNASQTYVLEFGNLYMRVHKDGALLTEAAKTITGATNANPCVLSVAAHGYSTGDEIAIATVEGMTELNNRNFKVVNIGGGTFSLQYMDGTAVDSTAFGTYTSGGTSAKIYELTTTYVEADLSTLQYAQSADTVTIVHPTYPPRELARTGDISWAIADISFDPSIDFPNNLTSDAPGVGYWYVVTAVDANTGEESLWGVWELTALATTTLTWDIVAAAGYYNLYRSDANGVFGLIGSAASNSFTDADLPADLETNPPEQWAGFNGVDDYPSTVAYYQQRLIFANTNNNPEGVWAGQTALGSNFSRLIPLVDSARVFFSMIGKQVNAVKHLVDSGKFLVFTSSAEWVVGGDAAGILTPTGINPNVQTSNGSGDLAPLLVNGSILFVQARGSIIRDLGFEFQTDGYIGNELTIFSNHLVDNYTIVDWAYQQIPQSIVWAVRSDGVLLGLTYVREHQIIAWHRHDTDGFIENVVVIPEGQEDVLYMVVKRTVDGNTVRYVERMTSRQIVDITDTILTDSTLSYDGTHSGSTTMTLTGLGWTYEDDLVLTASASFFVASDVGNSIHLTGSGGTLIRCEITVYTSPTAVTVRPHKTVPATMQAIAITSWGKAVDVVGGLWHLEGKAVSIMADGFVIASPNNTKYTTVTVEDGEIALTDGYVKIHVGLPVTADIETLNIDLPGVSSIADQGKSVTEVTAFMESTRGVFAGQDEDTLSELIIRDAESPDDPVDLFTGVETIKTAGQWKDSGKVFIRQVDPVPATILSIIPTGYI